MFYCILPIRIEFLAQWMTEWMNEWSGSREGHKTASILIDPDI